MSRVARVPRELAVVPFLGSRVVAQGLVTWSMLRGRSWRRLLPDTYVHSDAYDDGNHRMWCDAVALTLPPGAAVSGLSAAYLWGVDLLDRTSPVTVSLPPAAGPRRHARVAVSRQTLVVDDIVRFGDIAVTTPVRTAFDLGRQLSRVEAVVAIDAMLGRRVVHIDALQAYLDTRSGWPGAAQIRQVLMLVEPLSESPMETRVRLLLIDAGLPRPTAQHKVHDQRGRFIARVDLAYPQWRIAIEYEGDHHRERSHFRRDVARLNALRANGWIVLRFTADDVYVRPEALVAEVRRAIQERRTL